MLRRCGFLFSRGWGLRRGWRGAGLLLTDQGLEVGLKSWTIFRGVAQQDLDQAALPRAEMSLHAAAREAVQERDRLLNQQLFEFFGGHACLVARET